MKKTVLLATMLFGLASCAPNQPPTAENLEKLSLDLSGPGGYFDTDNLITNESSFQQVLPAVTRYGVRGGVYLGVGPAQNLTYIAHQKPELALLIDLRKDNRLLMLYLRALFLDSSNRWEYLSALLGRPLLPKTRLDPEAGAPQLAAAFRELAPDPDFFGQVWERSWSRMQAQTPLLLDDEDRERLLLMVTDFFRSGLDLRFRSYGRRARSDYPTLGRLMTETDGRGRRWHYLHTEADFQYLRQMQKQQRIVPVVGDLAGSQALSRIAGMLRERDLKVTSFYTSNVEFYLFSAGRFDAFVKNLDGLPRDERAVLIRSYFGYGFRHPLTRPGYRVTSVSQFADRFLDNHRRDPYESYADLLFRDYLIVE